MSQTFILCIHWWFHDVVGFLFQKWWHLHIFPTPVPNVPTYDILMTNRPKVRVICTPLYMKDLWGIPKVRWIFMNLHCRTLKNASLRLYVLLSLWFLAIWPTNTSAWPSFRWSKKVSWGLIGRGAGEQRAFCTKADISGHACLWELGTWTKIHVGEFLNAEFPGGF